MAKKRTPAQLKKELWELCKQITRRRYVRPDGTFVCYTCDSIIQEAKSAHTGHFLPSSTCGAYLRHNLRNLRIQDFRCNIQLGGSGAEYYRRMLEEVGEDEVAQLFRDKQKTVKADSIFYQNLIDEYKEILAVDNAK